MKDFIELIVGAIENIIMTFRLILTFFISFQAYEWLYGDFEVITSIDFMVNYWKDNPSETLCGFTVFTFSYFGIIVLEHLLLALFVSLYPFFRKLTDETKKVLPAWTLSHLKQNDNAEEIKDLVRSISSFAAMAVVAFFFCMISLRTFLALFLCFLITSVSALVLFDIDQLKSKDEQ